MSLKKKNRFLDRFVKPRNIIVISQNQVDHYPISLKSQLMVVGVFLAGLSWVSYTTGSYMSAQSRLKQKDATIQSVAIENQKMEQKFSLLKRDILKLNIDEKQLSDYDRYVLDQYSSNGDPLSRMTILQKDEKAAKATSDTMIERLAYLENKVESLENANQNLINTVRERTQGKIEELQDIIDLTGLSADKLSRHASVRNKLKKQDAANEDKSKRGEGGPLVPFDVSGEGQEKRVLSDLDRMMTLRTVVDMLPLGTPIAQASPRSPFGKRIDPFNHRLAMHTGLDLAGPVGSKIKAANAGKVVRAGRNGAYGNMVDVDHGMGIVTRYGHMSKISVAVGQQVKKGETVGIQGSTGRSTGPHLHYEVRYNDRPINPRKFLTAGEHVLKN